LRALITGISGFVGSHLAEYLLAQGDWEVAGTVYGKPDNIVHLGDRLQLFPAELSRLEVVRYIVEQTGPTTSSTWPVSATVHSKMSTGRTQLERSISSKLSMAPGSTQGYSLWDRQPNMARSVYPSCR